ncbi:hypothetical protein [Desulfosarcina sp. BuS5]|uniref:hypothetical protein n=1 Tax=Desulfosarcina sp. BuS5 TaxID=933262 RepID=UPI0012FBC295|nr:hypothetical protein [Desulfosarcina sp. BuS5]
MKQIPTQINALYETQLNQKAIPKKYALIIKNGYGIIWIFAINIIMSLLSKKVLPTTLVYT